MKFRFYLSQEDDGNLYPSIYNWDLNYDEDILSFVLYLEFIILLNFVFLFFSFFLSDDYFYFPLYIYCVFIIFFRVITIIFYQN